MNSIHWPALHVWVFKAQLVEYCSANAEATGSNPVENPENLFWLHLHFLGVFAVYITFIQYLN